VKLAGILCVRNGDRLDYGWREAGRSLLGVCDELVLSDCDSDDGTRQAMDEWAAKDSRITLCNFPWTDPRGDNMWYPTWVNYARQHCKSDHVIALDADELLHEDSYEEVRHAAENALTLICNRLNFWRDTRSLIPRGECCGCEVIRVAPANLWIPSDYPDPRADEAMKLAVASNVQILHYGFLRKRTAFFEKAREVQRIWANDYDPRLDAADKAGGNWMEHDGVVPWKDQLVPFTGTHPEIAKGWLRERGFTDV
jgi:glycosyltransferase involved in cell wall biosynthesis